MATVLVADDEADLLEMIAVKLSTAGHHVRTASDGADALMLAHTAAPDLAVLDVLMPVLSGITLCRVLRASPSTAHLPIMLVTARAQQIDVRDGFAAGADDYLVKPFSPRELVSRVDALLDHGRSCAATRAVRAATAATVGVTALSRLASR